MSNPDDEIAELEQKILELKKKRELLRSITLTVKAVHFDGFNVTFEYRRDYADFLAENIRRKHDHLSKVDWININDFDRWYEWVSSNETIIVNITNDQLALKEYVLRGPEVSISLHPEEMRVKIKPHADLYSKFGDAMAVIRYNGSTRLYHFPLSEAARVFNKVQDFVFWEEDAKKYAINQLNQKSILADIAKLEYSEEGDVKLHSDLSLKPFQTVGVHYQKAIGFRGIIGDEMGLGKTYQAIATAIKAESTRIAVVVPASVRENWRREILKSTSDIPVMLGGTVPDTIDMGLILSGKSKWYIFNYDMFSRPVKETVEKNGIHELRTRYPWAECINTLLFDHIILDEGHRIKNIDAGRTKAILSIKTPRVTVLSGTPVLNRPGELWPMLHLVAPDKFASYEGFLNRYTDGRNGARNSQELKELIAPHFIRRKKADVIKDLPPVIRTTKYVDLNSDDLDNYQKLMQQIRIDLSTGEEVGQINNVLEKILRVKQFLSSRKINAVADFAVETYDEAEEDDPHKKIIIFSQFVPCVDGISKLLGGECLTIVGSRHTPLERQKIVDRFQKDDSIKFLVASTNAANEGLNITIAGHVIFNDFMWTPAAHQQAEGRAYGRLNDAHTIEAHYFAVPKTLDDWLQAILQEKMAVIEEVVEGMGEAREQESSIFKALFKAFRGGLI